MTEITSRVGGAQARLGGAQALAAAAPAVFAPFSVLALSLDGAPLWAMLISVAGAAPLTATAGVAASNPLPARAFALACAPLALTATWFAWSSGGALSPSASWIFAALAAMAFLGGRNGALAAAGLAVALGAALVLAPAPPFTFIAAAKREQREIIAMLSWGCASFSVAAAAWAAIGAWTDALPPLRHPTIAARRALSLLVDAAHVCALRIDRDGVIGQVLGAAPETLGFQREQLHGLALASLAHPDDLPALGALFAQALALQDSPRAVRREAAAAPGMTLRLRSRHGGYRWLEATVAAAAGFPRPPEGTVSDTDVVLVLRARWRPDQDIDAGADPERSAFLAQMNSALRASLTAIVGYTDVMKNELFGPLGAERYREYARLAHDNAERMAELVDELTDLAEIEAGRYAGKPEMVDPVPLIDGAIRLVRAKAEQSGVALTADIAPNTPHIRADRQALRRAVLNMMLDAVRRGAMGDVAKLRVGLEDGAVRLTLLTTPRPGLAAAGAGAAVDAGAAVETGELGRDAAARTAIGEAKLGRIVAMSLIERMGGTLIFAGGVDDLGGAQGFDGGEETVYAEALLPAPVAADAGIGRAEARPDADAVAPKKARIRSERRRRQEQEAASRPPPEREPRSDIDRPLFAPPEPEISQIQPMIETAEEQPDAGSPRGPRAGDAPGGG